MDTPSILAYALTLTSTFKYLLVFIGTIVEGPILMVAAGFLLHINVFEPLPLYVSILLGDLVGDIGWYFAGYYFAEPFLRKHGHFMSLTPETFEKIKKLFHQYHERILFISKVTLGFGFALGTLVVAGATRVPFRRYIVINFIGEFVLVFILLSVGYFFAEIYKYVADGLKAGFVVISILIVGSVLFGFGRYMKKRTLAL